MRLFLAALCSVLAALVASSSVRAEGNAFAEIVAGMANPIGDDDYDDLVETSFKLGLRGGIYRNRPVAGGARLALELGIDWTPVANELDDAAGVDASFHRFRFLAGARANIDLAKNASLFFRAGAGIDYVIGEMTWINTFEENDLGLALECGAGVTIEAGGFLLGGQLAFPIAWHDDAGGDIPYDYTGYDIDLLFTAGKRF